MARSVTVIYYSGLIPVYVRTASLLSPILTLEDIQCTLIVNPVMYKYSVAQTLGNLYTNSIVKSVIITFMIMEIIICISYL